MEEIWKDIEGYEGIYAVSSFGRVRNLVSGKFIKPSQKMMIIVEFVYIKMVVENV